MIKTYVFIIVLFSIGSASAELIVNEAMVNEPGSNTSLEWVELYNDSIGALPLSGYQIATSTGTINLPVSVTLPAGGYYIVCRQLYASVTSPGFESYWGDSSGVWGDHIFEQGILEPFDSNLGGLNNTSGFVIVQKNSVTVSGFFWNGVSPDGVSWERIRPDTNGYAFSVSFSGSTPGKLNSLTPVPLDLAIDSVIVSRVNDLPTYTFSLTNRGTTTVTGVDLKINLESRHNVFPPVRTVTIPSMIPEETMLFEEIISLDGTFLDMMAYLSGDMRADNDTIFFKGIGTNFPPLELSEFVANPVGGLTGEWVEIKNKSSQSVDLQEWKLGDANSDYVITTTPLILPASDYLILTQNESNFLTFYPDFTGSSVQLSQWPILNNSDDIVRLVGPFGLLADSFRYVETFDNNRSWSRSEKSSELLWGESFDDGGTPGAENLLEIEQAAPSLVVVPEPEHFSPDGDGYQETTTIMLRAPEADGYTVKVYDRQGRVVKTFFDDVSSLPLDVTWDGYDDNNRRLPIGIYIIFAEAKGVESLKIPVVIAR